MLTKEGDLEVMSWSLWQVFYITATGVQLTGKKTTTVKPNRKLRQSISALQYALNYAVILWTVKSQGSYGKRHVSMVPCSQCWWTKVSEASDFAGVRDLGLNLLWYWRRKWYTRADCLQGSLSCTFNTQLLFFLLKQSCCWICRYLIIFETHKAEIWMVAARGK